MAPNPAVLAGGTIDWSPVGSATTNGNNSTTRPIPVLVVVDNKRKPQRGVRFAKAVEFSGRKKEQKNR